MRAAPRGVTALIRPSQRILIITSYGLEVAAGFVKWTAYSDISRQLRLPRYPVVSCDTAHSLATPAPTSRMGRSSLQRAEGKLPWTDATSSVEVMTKATASLGF